MANNILLTLLCWTLLLHGITCINLKEMETVEDNILLLSNLQSGNTSSFFEGEWLIVYMTTPCSVCGYFDPLFDKLTLVGDLKALKVAKIFLFPMDANNEYPLVFHIKDGLIRQYEGDLDFDKLVKYITKNESWSESKTISPTDCQGSLLASISAEFLNLIRGTLALAALILVFAWVIDLFSSNRPRRRSFTEMSEAMDTENSDVETTDDILDDSMYNKDSTTDASISNENLHFNHQEKESSSVSGEEVEQANNSETSLNSEQIELPCSSSKIKTEKVSLNPFSSTDSLDDSKDGGSSGKIGLVRQSIEVQPIPRVAFYIPQVQENKIEKSKVVKSEVYPKQVKSPKSAKSCLGGGKDSGSKMFKVDEINIEKPESYAAVTLETKLQLKQETIIVKPVAQETIYLEPINDDARQGKPKDSKETKC